MVPIPTGAEVLAFLGWPTDGHLVTQADQHAAQAATLARSYTRGRGFSVDDPYTLAINESNKVEEDIAACIISSAARSLSNPSAAKELSAGEFREAPGSFYGWSLVELVILQGWRRMAG